MSSQTLEVYEDGNIYRDFVYVDDVVSSLVASFDRGSQEIINIGSGYSISIKEVVEVLLCLAKANGFASDYQITGKFRDGDIRHAQADISKALKLLNWRPQVSLKEGLSRLVDWSLQFS